MSDESYLRDLFDTPGKKVETEVNKIPDEELKPDVGCPGPIIKFVQAVRDACAQTFAPRSTPVITSAKRNGESSPSEDEKSYVEPQVNAAAIYSYVLEKADNDLTTVDRDKERSIAADVATHFKNAPLAMEFQRYVLATNLQTALQRLLDQDSLMSRASEVVQQVAQRFQGAQTRPNESDWKGLAEIIDAYINPAHRDDSPKPPGCSLIYSYWLDEGGLPLAIERAADRIENGIVRATEPLRSVHVKEDADVADIVATFIASWQRSELLDVDSRRRQYHALYGFPLHAAKNWGEMHTVDPRHGFPSAMHGLLNEAHRYYRDQRNTEIVADPEPAKGALKRLLQALREGNENFRLRRPPQIRGQMEYAKRLLGGNVKGQPIADEWREYLPGRPGVEGAPEIKPWMGRVDAVAAAYGWRRPNIFEYVTLAENGEQLLVAVRVAGDAGVFDSDPATIAFLELLREPVIRYSNAFKVVSAVDLTRTALTVPPAVAMARQIQAPAIPPMKWSWAAHLPQTARAG